MSGGALRPPRDRGNGKNGEKNDETPGLDKFDVRTG